MSGTLYLVATPIGNLSDISARALETLKNVDFIAAEDTRVTRKLLTHFGIKKPLISYYEHNRRESGGKILSRIASGENCALVTDSGTPGLSDPGEDLVFLCTDADVPVIIIPGPCAAVAALTLSGIAAGRFAFEGFLPARKKQRVLYLHELKNEKRTMVFYEAPHKLINTLKDMLEVFGDRRISISREMTKIYEETLRMRISEAIAHYETIAPRGEFVFVVEGVKHSPAHDKKLDAAIATASELISGGLSVKDAVKEAADKTGCSKNTLYKAVTSCFK